MPNSRPRKKQKTEESCGAKTSKPEGHISGAAAVDTSGSSTSSPLRGAAVVGRSKRTVKKKTTGGQRCNPVDAVEALVQNNDGSVTVVLRGGWKEVLEPISEDDPASLIMWDSANLTATVTALNTAGARPGAAAPPGWLGAAYPISVAQLQLAIITRINALSGGGGVAGDCVIHGNDLQQYGRVREQLGYFLFEPVMANAACPLGRHFVLKDRQATALAIADPVGPPPAPGRPVLQ